MMKFDPVITLLEGKEYRPTNVQAHMSWPLTRREALTPSEYAQGIECIDLTPRPVKPAGLWNWIRSLVSK